MTSSEYVMALALELDLALALALQSVALGVDLFVAVHRATVHRVSIMHTTDILKIALEEKLNIMIFLRFACGELTVELVFELKFILWIVQGQGILI